MNEGVFRGSGKTGEVATYEAWLGRPVPYVLDFVGRSTSTTDPWAMIDDPSWVCNRWRDSGRHLVLSAGLLPNKNFTLAALARGDYDTHIVKFFRTVVARGQGNCTLRPLWEFNIKAFGWAAGGQEATFVKAWRRIHGIARANGFTGLFDWCPLAGNTNAAVEACYPGDAYVDVIGLDAYDTCNKPLVGSERWRNQCTRPIGLDWHKRFALSHNKPRSFPEWGITTRPNDNLGGGDNAFYVTQMRAWAHDVLYVCYFDVDANDGAHRLSPPTQFPKSSAAMLA